MDKESSYIRTSVSQEAEFQGGRFNPKTVFENERVKVILAYFKEGQFIPVHTPNIDLVLCVIEGQGEMAVDQDRFPLKAGDLVVVPKGVPRGVRAGSDMVVLHTVTPPPAAEDHAQVRAKLQQGRFD